MDVIRRIRGWGLRHVLLPLGDNLIGHPMIRRLGHLEREQWWPRERIEQERNRRLAHLIGTAYREVPLYRELLDRAKVCPACVRSPEDLQKLPIVTKEMLREAYPQRTCRAVPGRTYETSTSGSTGKNLRVREDHETAAWYRATFLLSLEWAGWQIGESHIQIGMTTRRDRERRLKDFFMGCHYFSGHDLSDPALDRCLEVLDRKPIRHLWGYPGSLYCLARRAQHHRWNTPLSSIVTWGDQLHSHFRQTIESVFGTGVHDTYGCGEGMQIAAQCGHSPLYHLHELDVVVEFLDEQGEPVGPGQAGNIVVTRLHAGPMPFIRYSIGDVGVPGGADQCSCGRELRLLKNIQGRSGDFVLSPSGNRLIVHFFTGILEHFSEVDSFQVVQDRIHEIRLRVVPGPGFNAKVAEQICRALHNKGADLEVVVEVVNEIPLTPGGKRKFIVRDPSVHEISSSAAN